MTTRKRSNIITLNIHAFYEVSECRMSVHICTVYRIQSQTNIFVHRYSKYMCTAISRRLYVCHNFGTLKMGGKNQFFYIHKHLTLAHMYSHFIKQLSERRIQMSSWLFTRKKKQHWYSRSFFTVVSLCNTILIIKSHSNFSHCHSSHPWWLVPENDDVVYVTCNTAGFLNGVSKRVQCFGNRVCFHFEVTKIRNHLHIPYGRKRWCQPLTQRLTKCSSDSECLLISEHNGWVGPHLPWGWGWKQVQLPRYLSLRKRSDSYSWLLLLVISWQTSSRKLHTNKATNHVKVKLFSHYDIHCGFRRNVTFPKHDTRNLLKIIQT